MLWMLSSICSLQHHGVKTSSRVRGEIQFLLGISRLSSNDLENALLQFKQVLDLYQGQKERPKLYYNVVHAVGWIHCMRNQCQTAIQHFNKHRCISANRQATARDGREWVIAILIRMGDAAYQNGEWLEAAKLYHKTLSIAREGPRRCTFLAPKVTTKRLSTTIKKFRFGTTQFSPSML
jgi:tetratricopeptide (TPR) repeat protein